MLTELCITVCTSRPIQCMFADLLIVFECILVGQNCFNYYKRCCSFVPDNLHLFSVFTEINTVLHTAHVENLDFL